MARSPEPERRLLAIFDVFDGWFHGPDFEGCSFINVLLESPNGGARPDMPRRPISPRSAPSSPGSPPRPGWPNPSASRALGTS